MTPTEEAYITFKDCGLECARYPDFIKEFNRLTGRHFGKSLSRKPIEVMIDEATGHPSEDEADLKAFVAFVYEVVWCPLLAQEGKI